MKYDSLHKAVIGVLQEKKALHPNQQKLDVHEPEKDELTSKDFEMLRAGKKAKTVKEEHFSIVNGKKQSSNELVWKQTSMSHDEAVKKHGKENVKIGGKDRLGRDTVHVKVPLVAKEEHVKEEAEQQEEPVNETIEIHDAFNVEMKESYSFGDYLFTAKKLVGEEEAIHLANKAYCEQDESIFIEEYSQAAVEDKVKAHMNAGHKVSMPKYSTRDGKPRAEYVVTDKESGVRRKYIHQGNVTKMENMGARGKKDEK